MVNVGASLLDGPQMILGSQYLHPCNLGVPANNADFFNSWSYTYIDIQVNLYAVLLY